MTDAMSDVIEYWDIRCDDCKQKYPDVHSKCIEGRDYPDTYHCRMMGKKHNLIH